MERDLHDKAVQQRLYGYILQFEQTAVVNRALGTHLSPGDLDDWPIDVVEMAIQWSAQNQPSR